MSNDGASPIPTPVAPNAIGGLPVTAVMAEQIVALPPGASIEQVAEAMIDGDVGLVVLGDGTDELGRSVVSVVSERDVVRAVARGLPLGATPASDVGTARIVWCSADQSVTEVACEMLEHYVRHVLIEDEGRLIGVVSARDLLGVLAAESMAGLDVDG